MNKESNLILFDGQCKLCNVYCNFIINRDKKCVFTLTPMQSEKGQDLLIKNNYPTQKFESMLYIENNTLYEKSTAFLEIIKHLPYPTKALYLTKYIPKFIRDYIYILIAKNRYKVFGKYSVCTLPKVDHDERII